MLSVKEVFPTNELFYKSFTANEEGQKIWQQAVVSYPKYHIGSNDTEKAIKDIFLGMGDWLYAQEPAMNDIDIEAFLDTHGYDLRELIHDELVKTKKTK